jgi:hypothetical protein
MSERPICEPEDHNWIQAGLVMTGEVKLDFPAYQLQNVDIEVCEYCRLLRYPVPTPVNKL